MNTTTPPIAFDSSRAWSDATAAVSANRDTLLALAGVFLVLPAFAMAVLIPPPEPQTGASMQALLATMGEYYLSNSVWLIGASLIHLLGTLAMLTLITDQTRPTVGQAIKQAFANLPSVIAAQLLLGMAIGAMVLLPVALGGALKSPVITGFTLLTAVGLGIWAMIRLALVSPAVVVDRLINPITALKRSWQLTEGNVLRLLAFFALLSIAFLVVIALAESAIRFGLTLLVGATNAALGAALVASILQAVMTVYFVAVTATAHRQLASLAGPEVASRFD